MKYTKFFMMLIVLASTSCSCDHSLKNPSDTHEQITGTEDVSITDNVKSDYVHASGTYIFDADGEMLILKGVGLGGWMVQEGYMLGTSGAQNEIRSKIEAVAGKNATDSFYNDWLEYFITEADIQQISEWGFNSVRIPLHYELFFNGETWAGDNSRGMQLTDKVVQWCKNHGMYAILDLHAAPGGQGNNKNISDRREGESLWEDVKFQDMTVAMWKGLAEHYVKEKIIAGYDLINEPNYTFSSQTPNAPLTALYKRIIDAIREVDGNHLLILEGNDYGGNYDGMDELSDYDPLKNLAISFHGYYGRNAQDAIQSKLDLRIKWNVPLWRGETGENSNTWFTETVELCDRNRIGWANWPWKKFGSHDGPVQIVNADRWDEMASYLSGGSAPAHAEDILKSMIEAIKIENCRLMPDVAYAWIDLPAGLGPKPYAKNTIPGMIFITDYDMGKYKQTWYDTDYQNTTGKSSEKKANIGRAYRNDGVDIWESSKDNSDETNGYFVGEIKDGEWMQYTLESVTPGKYQVYLRYRSSNSTGRIVISCDGKNVLEKTLEGNGNVWTTTLIGSATVPATSTMRITSEKGNYDMTSLIFKK